MHTDTTQTWLTGGSFSKKNRTADFKRQLRCQLIWFQNKAKFHKVTAVETSIEQVFFFTLQISKDN